MQVHRVPCAEYRRFDSHGAALAFLRVDSASQGGGGSAASRATKATAGSGARKRCRGAAAGASVAAVASIAGVPDDGTWVAYFDGGARGNPGVGGAGACVLVQGAVVASAVQGCTFPCTNNQAECLGAALALRLVSSLLDRAPPTPPALPLPPPSRVVLLGDSKLIVKQVRGEWRVHAAHLVGPVGELRELAAQMHCRVLPGGLHVSHVPRGANTRADALSNVAMDALRDAQRNTLRNTQRNDLVNAVGDTARGVIPCALPVPAYPPPHTASVHLLQKDTVPHLHAVGGTWMAGVWYAGGADHLAGAGVPVCPLAQGAP